MSSYVIGDIHGCLDELRWLLDSLSLRPPDRLVFLGDYVDRGPDSSRVISYLIQLRSESPCECIFLKGNHEDMFMAYLGLPGAYGDMFIYNGGRATLSSYGINAMAANAKDIRAQIPPQHIEFLENLKPYYLMDPYLCVHAGVHPLKTLDQQSPLELFWIRNEFIYNRHCLPYTVLFGHTPQKEVLIDLPLKIGLDTGLVYGNKLSCLDVEGKLLFQIGRGKKKITRTSINLNR